MNYAYVVIESVLHKNESFQFIEIIFDTYEQALSYMDKKGPVYTRNKSELDWHCRSIHSGHIVPGSSYEIREYEIGNKNFKRV
jgi:hypothetical protein